MQDIVMSKGKKIKIERNVGNLAEEKKNATPKTPKPQNPKTPKPQNPYLGSGIE